MSGIIFLGTRQLPEIRDFYVNMIGTQIWLEQHDCIILKHGNLLLGFCKRDICDIGGIITFFYSMEKDVDEQYEKLKNDGAEEPKRNDTYRIYHFFARDPEDRTIEFQAFTHPVDRFLDGTDLLITRRSVRHFQLREIPLKILWEILDRCCFAPTSHNSQSYYFIVVKEKKKLEFLASRRGRSSAHIARAPMAIAICSDPEKSRRHMQDGCIAAYHLLLTCWQFGLGTCWIAAMDRDDVKMALDIPNDNYIATITPVGYPAKIPQLPSRRASMEMVRFVE